MVRLSDLDSALDDLRDVENRLRKAHDLIAWFAQKYERNNPLFPVVDPMTGTPLDANRELRDTWFDVVRHGVVCEECGGSGNEYFSTNQPGVFTLGVCPHCDGRGFTQSTGEPEEQESSGKLPEPTEER